MPLGAVARRASPSQSPGRVCHEAGENHGNDAQPEWDNPSGNHGIPLKEKPCCMKEASEKKEKAYFG